MVAMVAATLLVTLCCFLVLKVAWWRPRRTEQHFQRQGIRGPPYRVLLGNVREVVAMMAKASSQTMPLLSHNILPRVLPFYHHWNKLFGPTFLVWFGPTARLTVADPNLIRLIFTSSTSDLYEKNDPHPLVKNLEGDGLLTLKGHKWARHRKIIAPTFHFHNLKLLVPVVGKSVTDLLEKWDGSESGEIEIEVSEWFQAVTEDVITRTAFGASYDDGIAIFRLQARQMLLAAQAFQKVFIPGYRFLPTRLNVESWRLDREIRKSLVKLIERRRGISERLSSDGGGPSKDLLGVLIEASSGDSGSGVTVKDIVEECKSFFFAGKHTTSNLMTWTTILLAMHPHWQALAREEVIRVCGSRDLPSSDQLLSLKTLTMIINESLRLYPPIIATIRRAKGDVELGGYSIPGGTELLVPILAVHHDQALWGSNANEFDPGRFSQGVARAAKHPMAFIPFGLGPRTCIGQNLAVLQAKLALSIILQRFSFRLSPRYQHAPTVLMLLYPQYGAPVIFKRLHKQEHPLSD